MDITERQKKLEDLIDYINNAEERANKILKNLNWTPDRTLEAFNTNNEHDQVEKTECSDCKDDPEYPDTLKGLHSITLAQEDLNKIFAQDDETNQNALATLPNRFSDMQTKLSREQKLNIYDYVISATGRLTEPESVLITREEKNSKMMSFAEIVALRRDLKRRRMKHRVGKNLPLSITEEFRNLIDIQMNALEEYHRKNESSLTKSSNEGKRSHRSRSRTRDKIDRDHMKKKNKKSLKQDDGGSGKSSRKEHRHRSQERYSAKDQEKKSNKSKHKSGEKDEKRHVKSARRSRSKSTKKEKKKRHKRHKSRSR